MKEKKKVKCCMNCKFCYKPCYLEQVYYCMKDEMRLMTFSAKDVIVPPMERIEPDNVCEDYE